VLQTTSLGSFNDIYDGDKLSIDDDDDDDINKIGNVYSLEYTEILKVFFMPNYIGHFCANIRGYC
jgi:hypothetical protein